MSWASVPLAVLDRRGFDEAETSKTSIIEGLLQLTDFITKN